MRKPLLLILLAGLGLALGGPARAATPAQPHKLLVVSVDGLDWRYLRDRDRLGLKIPNLRRLMRDGETADGVAGVWPTVTWPSHTSLITGVRPDQHGILGNRRPREEGGDYYWTVDLLRAPTLWACAGGHGRTTASVTWPVTTDAPITWNLPEYFKRRNGGSMDLEGVASKATPGLVEAISRAFPSFPQQWVDDRTRAQAVLYLLREKRPDLVLVHMVDLDSEAHDQGPFAQNADAILERTDELIGQMATALPSGYRLVVTSDHGFERLDHIANIPVLLKEAGVAGEARAMGGLVVTQDRAVAAYLRGLSARKAEGIGREVPKDELERYAPALAGVEAAFEPAEHYMFGRNATGPYLTKPQEIGEHGFWPLRADYRSVFIAYGPGIAAHKAPQIEMVSIKDRLAALMDLRCP